MKIVTLVENHTESELECEHGLSFYIEFRGRAYLLDAGQTGLFARNAKSMGVDLTQVDSAVLSHAHYDHAGGFAEFAQMNHSAPVFMQRNAVCRYFSRKPGGMKEIGVPEDVFAKLGERIRYVDGDVRISDGVWLIAHHTGGLDKRGAQMGMYCEVEGEKMYDNFSHEHSLVFESEKGLVVFNSCSHGGVDLILREICDAFPEKPILAMFGGFHLMGSGGPESMRESEEDVRSLGERLLRLPVEKLYTGHCTGTKAYPILKEVLKDKLELLVTGRTVEIHEVS
nr:MBL fold metallo-hydrolase [Lachnospiraceae bacterium]